MERNNNNSSARNKNLVKNECVQVVVRCRPMSKKEQASGEYKQVVDVYPSRGVVEIQHPSNTNRENRKMFTYDAVYDKSATQKSLYDEVVRPLVSSVLEGFNCCVFAYGQTGTGKTFTMEGIRSKNVRASAIDSIGENNKELEGIIPRAFEQIWSNISRLENMNFLVAVSYLEIYMEELRDLLKPNSSKSLELREHEQMGVYVPNLHSVLCKNVDEMLNVMAQGNKNRTTGKTNMNEHSSRSHAIFMIKIEMCDLDTNKVKVGKLNLIDLAGSERQSKTGATADRLKEASKINRALSSLGNVISALAENSPHIPYRDSKLTRLLQDSLGGNSKTIMIANIGPSSYNYNETVTTLRYAQRAKTIQNKPVKNEDPQDAKLKEYQQEIAKLRQMIAERQNKEKTIPKRKKKKSIIEVISKNELNQYDDEDDDDKDDDVSDNEKDSINDAMAETNEALTREKEITNTLTTKLTEMESRLVRGGRNILDTYNERQIELEKKLEEIAERKKREVEMQQQLELQEETTIEIRETLTSVQQEVELKTRKLKKCYAKYMALKQELIDTRDEHNRERRELEMSQNDLIKELKRILLLVDNFVPIEVKTRLYTQARYDEELEEWTNNSSRLTDNTPLRRPVSQPHRRRPISEYALKLMQRNDDDSINIRGENILMHELDMPLRTTTDYKNPKISASLQAVLAEALSTDDDVDITGQTNQQIMRSRLDKILNRNAQEPIQNRVQSSSRIKSSKPDVGMTARRSVSSSRKQPTSAYPKSRGLITK
ncbi:kinesin-like protein Klp68D [Contarinia nasturtii]|uniref:kinesin-like protein Klp68D n=1 Tax=Contarinia nasturtii TaxID=265458 RepID=UPI0012D46217|nr:kinesin-like protein Klp68D [Contarinia nasturtii]